MTTESLSHGTDGAFGVPWYALRVRSNHEKTVRRYLDYAGADCYLPLYRAETRWSDRSKQLERVLFPGYCFVRSSDVGSLLEVAGVCGVLGGLTPAAIPAAEIESVRLLIASMRPLTATDFAIGERVTIAHGSLKGVRGVVERVKSGLRLVVNIEMLGRGVAVELDCDNLQRDRRAAA